VQAEYRFQFLPNSAVSEAQIVFLPIAYDETVCGARGTAGGPQAIFDASEQLEYYEEHLGWSPFLHMRPCVRPELRQEDGETEAAFHARIAAEAKAVHDPQGARLLIALGGEHSITPSVIGGCLASPATIIVLDAHADLRSSYKGSPLNHACTMHRLRALSHRVIIIGLRSLADFEAASLESDAQITTYRAQSLQSEDGREAMLQALSALKGDVWLSVDMDAFDPSLVPSVGTPQPGGLDWYLAIDILHAVFKNPAARLCGMDVVEVIPEASQVSQLTAAKLVQNAISLWGKRNAYHEAPRDGAQAHVAYE